MMRRGWLRRLVTLRRRLARCAEPSGREEKTAGTIEAFFRRTGIGEVVRAPVGNGLLVRLKSNCGDLPASRVVLRCELDALPIPQVRMVSGRPVPDCHSHRCGHDGHMAIVAAVGVRFHLEPVSGVELVLLFQPSEETGEGAREIISSGLLDPPAPRMIMGFHNLPGEPLGEVVVRPGVFASASCGWSARLSGRTAHAAQPQEGRPPTLAVTVLAGYLESMAQRAGALEAPVKVTVVHLRVGQPAFGTSPGEGVVMATFRAWSDDILARTMALADRFAVQLAEASALTCELARHEGFLCTSSDPDLTARFSDFLERSGTRHRVREFPFPWSEDFGSYSELAPLLYFGLGAGTDTPALHHPDYDFPEALISEGSEIIYNFISDHFHAEEGSS